MSASVHTAEKPAKATIKAPKRAKKSPPPAVRAPPTTWDDLIAQLAKAPGLAPMTALAMAKRDEGMGVSEFCEQALDSFHTAQVHTDLTTVFDLSDAAGWDMPTEAIHRALAALKSGLTPAAAYALARHEAAATTVRESDALAALFKMVPADRVEECARSQSRMIEKGERACREARAAAEDFPALQALAEHWCGQEATERPLSLAHNIAECIGEDDLIEAADAAWQVALDDLGAAAVAILDHPVTSAVEALAKYKVYAAVASIYDPVEDEDEVKALKRDMEGLAAIQPAPQGPNPSRTAWDSVFAAYEAAEAVEASDEAADGAIDAAAAAQEAVLMTPAPNLRAVATKLSFVGEFMRFGEHLTEGLARELLGRDNSWTDRCIAAAFLDLLRLGSDGAAGLDLNLAGADAAIIEAALTFKALSDEFDDTGSYRVGGSNEADRLRCNELSEAKQPVLDFLMASRATTLEGFKAKAMVAKWYAPTVETNDYEDLEWKLHRSLTDDLLADGGIPAHPDAEVIALAEDFITKRQQWYALPLPVDFDENASPFKETSDAASDAYDALVEHRAGTPTGVVALVQALRVAQSTDLDEASFDPEEVPHYMLMRAVCDSAWALRSGPRLEPAAQRWAAARSAWLAALADENRIDDEIDAIDSDIRANIVPVPPELIAPEGHMRQASDIAEDPTIPEDDKERLTGLRTAWGTLYKAAAARRGIPELDTLSSDANLHTYHALMAYLQTPPASLRALATQMREAINRDVVEGSGESVDDPEVMRQLLADDEASTNYLAMTYQHVLRLLGDDSPILLCRRDFDTSKAEAPADRVAA